MNRRDDFGPELFAAVLMLLTAVAMILIGAGMARLAGAVLP